jgi:hypothetical protein
MEFGNPAATLWNARAAALCAAITLIAHSASANMAPPVHDFRAGLALARNAEGLRVTSLEKNGTAEKVGVHVGDILLSIDGHWFKAMPAADVKAFVEAVHGWPIELILVRDRARVQSLTLKKQ